MLALASATDPRWVTGALASATTTLNGVTDAASAQAALPKLTEVNDKLDQLGGLVGQLPAEGKTALAALINGALPDLEALIAKVSEIPGVGTVIKPAADAMVAVAAIAAAALATGVDRQGAEKLQRDAAEQELASGKHGRRHGLPSPAPVEASGATVSFIT